MDSVLQLLTLLMMNGVMGGGLAYALDRIPRFKDWDSPYKPFAVMFLTALAGGLILFLQSLTPQYWSVIPEQLQIVLAWMATWLGSQLAHQHDVLNQPLDVRKMTIGVGGTTLLKEEKPL